MIQEKKDSAIKELTGKHAKKYADIKTYYADITNTNLDIINNLKDTLALERKEDADTRRKKSDQEDKNNQVVEPLNEANEEVIRLQEQKKRHDVIMGELGTCQQGIFHYDDALKEIEW